MPIDFFTNPYSRTTDAARFGLCDDVAAVDCPKNPAYIDEVDDSKWTAEVDNKARLTTTFYPIDNCIEILRPDGSMDNRCDGMIEYAGNLIFVELKDRAGGKWIGEGLHQLEVTIRNFLANHNPAKYHSIRAQICNRQRPRTVISCKSVIEKFKDDTGYLVTVDRKITL